MPGHTCVCDCTVYGFGHVRDHHVGQGPLRNCVCVNEVFNLCRYIFHRRRLEGSCFY